MKRKTYNLMNMKVIKIFLSIISLFFIMDISAQCYFIDPPEQDPVLTDCASEYGWILPATGTVRILIIFAEIDYDVNPANDPNPNTNADWPLHSIPSWVDEFCDPNVPTGTAQGLFTRYYQQASSGNYYVLGDYLKAPYSGGIFSVKESEIAQSSYQGALKDEIEISMNGNFVTGNNLNSVTYFDNWTKTGVYQEKITPSIDNPNKIDHVMVIWRNRIGLNNVGWGYPGSYASILGFYSDCYTEFGTYRRNPYTCARHEYAHMILGGNLFHTYPHYGGYWLPYVGGWGALSLYDASLMCWSGWDRQRLAWEDQSNQYNPAARNANNTAEVNGDLDATESSQAGIYYLRDFVATGDALRIKLPYLDPNSDYQQWLWIENHNGISENNNAFDKFQFEEGNSCVEGVVPGLYMYVQIDKDTREGTSTEVGSGKADFLRPVTADGFFDRVYTDEVQNQCVNSQLYRPFSLLPERENPFTGGGDQELYALDLDNDGEIDSDENIMNFIQKDGNNYFHNLFSLGHSRHAFTFTGNNKIGIGTNPSASNMMSLYSYNAPAPSWEKNVRKIYLNGVSVEIINQDSSNNIQVRVRFNDVDVINDRRWCADSIVLTPPPHSAIYSLNVTDTATITLDWSKTATRISNPYEYEDDTFFSSPTMFVGIAESILHIDTSSMMELINISTLQLLDDATLQIEPGAQLIIKEGSNFIARSGSETIIKGNGKIIVEAGAYICIEDGAIVDLQDVSSSIVLNDGFVEGVNPYIEVLPATNCSDICEFNPSGLGSITNAPDYVNDLTVSSSVVWSDVNYSFGGNLIVSSTGELTIENESVLKFNDDNKIIIETGGKLILDDSRITSLENCFGDLWHGIEVWGNPEATQIPANQGWLSISNGGTIENAAVAVRVDSEDYDDMGGGIVHTDGAVFRNNRSGVIYEGYAGYNIGNFTLTTFETTAELVDGSLPDAHIRLVGVEGIQINGCTFRNTRDGNTPYSQRGIGIKSFDASYYVDHFCISQSVPCTQYQETVFDSLNYGIKAYAIFTVLTPSIENSEFTRNYRGAYLSGITNARITSNEFILNGTAAGESYGLYLDACNQYWVENNHFEKSSTTSTQTGIGIYISESGDEPNEIYLNVFDSVEYSVIALGNNRYGRRPEIGLQIRCNDYNNTQFDEVIVYDGPSDPPPSDDGIASLQGANTANAEDMAGNLFYYNTDVSGDFDDINNQSNHFYYYYSNDANNLPVEPLDYTTNTVTKVPKTIHNWTYEVGCPSGLISGGGGTIEEARSAMAVAQANIESSEAMLQALVDGGDTETLNTEVQSSTPPETEAVYNELMAESPNLSETVVESSIEKETVLPNAMIRDVMVANPHTSTSLQLLDKLDQRNNPMPAFMKAQILAGRSITSLKSELEGQIAAYTLRKVRARNRIVRYFGETPGLPAKTDSLLALYQTDNSLSSRYMQAWLYMQNGQYLQGQNVMTAIPSDFTLSADELAEQQNMQSLYTLLTELYEAGKQVNDLSAAQQGQLETMVLAETGLAPIFARNLLMAADAMQYAEPVTLPSQLKSAAAEEAYKELINAPMPKILEVYPNPSKDFVILGYRFDADTRGVIEIRDVSGSLIQSIPFTGMQDQLTVMTRSWSPGIYMVSLMVNEKVIETTKFTLIN